MPTDPSPAGQPIPSDVQQRLRYWHSLWYASAQYHYLFGVISVAASVIATAIQGDNAKYFSTIAAIATALIGFVHPERRYVKFVRAWRVLDLAAMRYRHGLTDRAALIDAVEQGEALLAEFEDRYSDGGKAHDAAVAAAAATAAVAVTQSVDPGAVVALPSAARTDGAPGSAPAPAPAAGPGQAPAGPSRGQPGP